ncbi:MAG: flagellar basal body rod protein FlgC [Desulfobacteraceae bacterium]
MDLLRTIDLAADGMSAQRTRLNVISMNLANANTTRTADGTPYRRKTAVFQSTPMERSNPGQSSFQDALDKELYGVEVKEITPVRGPFKQVFDPSHPDANESGYVHLPNVNLVEEMVLMLNANRGYEANASAVKTAKDMALKALEIGS